MPAEKIQIINSQSLMEMELLNSGVFHSANFQEVIDLQKAIYQKLCRIAEKN